MFALAMTLVVLISSVVLLYQYWSGSLAGERDGTVTPLDIADDARDGRETRPVFRADNAA
jgi:hypothetical protein